MKRAYLYLIDFVLPLPMAAAYHFIVRKGNADPWTFALLIATGLVLMGVAALQYVIKSRCEQ